MLVAQRVNDLLTQRKPDALCDACIVSALTLSTPAHAAQITAALGTTSEFERAHGACSMCGARRIVIKAL